MISKALNRFVILECMAGSLLVAVICILLLSFSYSVPSYSKANSTNPVVEDINTVPGVSPVLVAHHELHKKGEITNKEMAYFLIQFMDRKVSSMLSLLDIREDVYNLPISPVDYTQASFYVEGDSIKFVGISPVDLLESVVYEVEDKVNYLEGYTKKR